MPVAAAAVDRLSALRTFPVCAVAVLFIGMTFARESSPFMRGVGVLFLLGLALDTVWLVGRGALARRS
ncbi:hypothetical protein ACYJW8_15675 [Frateuria aurantia]